MLIYRRAFYKVKRPQVRNSRSSGISSISSCSCKICAFLDHRISIKTVLVVVVVLLAALTSVWQYPLTRVFRTNHSYFLPRIVTPCGRMLSLGPVWKERVTYWQPSNKIVLIKTRRLTSDYDFFLFNMAMRTIIKIVNWSVNSSCVKFAQVRNTCGPWPDSWHILVKLCGSHTVHCSEFK